MPKNPHAFRQASPSLIGKAAPDGLNSSSDDKSASLHPAELPIVSDPFSRLGDEIAGATPDEIALNLGASVRISLRYRAPLQHEAPDLRKLFRGTKLTEPAKESLRFAERTFETARQKQ